MRSIITLLAATALTTGVAGGDIINFESLPVGTAVTTQYPAATFSSTEGHENRVMADYEFGTGQYIVTAFVDGEIDAVNSTIVDFTEPVSGLRFFALGDDSAGAHAMVDVYVDGLFVTDLPIYVDGIFDTPDMVDLTAFIGVTKIEIWGISDPAGLAWDRFMFDPMPDPCPADITDDGLVNVADLLAVLGAFGSIGGPADVTGDGVVNTLDLLMVLSMWGACA